MRLAFLYGGLGVALVLTVSPGAALGQTKAPREAPAEKPAAQPAKPAAKALTPKRSLAPKSKKAKPAPATAAPSQEVPATSPPGEAPKGSGESAVKPAGHPAPRGGSGAQGSVKEKEDPEGVKTYQFGAIEVEGRLKSPQLIYFLRRVRAEFEAGALGHRSFLGELSDTRNAAVFR